MPLKIGLMVVLLMFILHREYGFSSVRVGAILENESGIQGRNFVALLQGSEMTVGSPCWNWII